MSRRSHPSFQFSFISARGLARCAGLALLLMLGACGRGGADGAAQKLVLTGSSTVAPLVSETAKRYEAAHPGVRIDVQTGGSSRGISDARSGLADIGMASRALRPEEADLTGTVIARDGIGVIVHAENPVAALSGEQIRGIYAGTITRWSQVGGRDAPVTVINKAEGRSTLELFLAHFRLKAEDIRASVIIGDNEQGIKTLIGNPDGIAYVSVGSAEYAITHGSPIRLLPLDGVAASTGNVRNGSFPLSRPLMLVTRQPPAGLARDFIDYARSPAVHDIVRQQYFVPLD